VPSDAARQHHAPRHQAIRAVGIAQRHRHEHQREQPHAARPRRLLHGPCVGELETLGIKPKRTPREDSELAACELSYATR
jgi:hypothetical protein